MYLGVALAVFGCVVRDLASEVLDGNMDFDIKLPRFISKIDDFGSLEEFEPRRIFFIYRAVVLGKI